MTYHTQFLKLLLVLVMVMLPLGLGSNISYFVSTAIKKRSIGINLLGMIIAYSLIAILVWCVGYKSVFYFKSAQIYIYICAPLLGITCISVEYCIGVVMYFVTTGKWVFKISIHSSYSNEERIGSFDISMVVLFVVVEEIIFRQVLFNILDINFNMSKISIILVCALVYAINHINFGVLTVPQKIFSGLIYTSFYVFSGYSIFIPIIGHATQNLLLLFASRAGELK